MKNSALAVNSPLVVAAKTGKTVKKEDVGTAKSLDKSGIPAFEADGMEEVKAQIAEITDPLTLFGENLDAYSLEAPLLYRLLLDLNKKGAGIDSSKIKTADDLAKEIARKRNERGL